MTETRLVDTNVLLRFFTGSPADLAEKAKEIVTVADAGNLVLEILPLVLAETIYTLQSFYEMPKDEVCDRLLAFVASRGIQARDEDVMLDALRRYRAHNIHFVDACLAAYGMAGNQPVHSFDSDFGQFPDLTRKS